MVCVAWTMDWNVQNRVCGIEDQVWDMECGDWCGTLKIEVGHGGLSVGYGGWGVERREWNGEVGRQSVAHRGWSTETEGYSMGHGEYGNWKMEGGAWSMSVKHAGIQCRAWRTGCGTWRMECRD